MNKYLYKIKDLEMTPWLKYWFARKSKVNFDLSQILNGTNFDLENSVNKKLHLIDIFGNSVQETTTGKNLLNPYTRNKTTYGVTCTYDENTQEITLNGTCNRDNTAFYFTKSNSFNLQSGESLYALIKYISGSSNGYLSLRGYNSDYSQGIIIATTEPLTDDIFTDIYDKDAVFNQFSIRVNEGSTFDNLKIKLMISKVDAVYEPYTDGASPNPNYPQEIYSAGDNNYINEKIINKNFYNKNQAYSKGKRLDIETGELSNASGTAWCVTDYIKVRNNNKFTLSGKIVPNTWSLRICGYNKDKQFIEGLIYNYTQEKQVVNFEEKVDYIKFGFYNFIDGQPNNRDFQLELGENATTYLEHQEQLYTIPCQQPMRAIGEVKDTFVKVDGVWYERHNIREYIANDNLLGNGETENTINLTTPTLPIEANILPNSLSLKVKSNILQSTINDYSGFNGTTGANRIRIALSKSFALTSEEAKTFLYQKGLKIIYVTTEPLDLPCTQTQITALENLQKARTYKNITHIYSEDEVPAELEIQYYKEKGE